MIGMLGSAEIDRASEGGKATSTKQGCARADGGARARHGGASAQTSVAYCACTQKGGACARFSLFPFARFIIN